MRQDIHPAYHKVKAVCVCGNVIETGSTMADIRLDVCSACHPFYTGTQKIMDTEGRVDKFNKRYANAVKGGKKAEKAVPAEKTAAEETPAAEA